MENDLMALIRGLDERVRRVAALLGVKAPETGLPVVSVPDVCTVEVGAEDITVLTRMKKETALIYDFARLEGREFEAYGARNVAKDLFTWKTPEAEVRGVLSRCAEEEILFSFAAEEKKLADLVYFLINEGFFDRR